jgi:hypothetical protein
VRIGRVLDRSFKILRDNLLLVYGAIVIVYLPVFILHFVMRYTEVAVQTAAVGPFFQVSNLLAAWLGAAVGWFIWMFIVPLGTMAVTFAIFAIYTGRSVGIGGAYREVLRLFLRALGLTLIKGLIVGIGMLFCFVPGIIAAIALYVVFPVCVVEKLPLFETLERSYRLTKRNTMTIFVIGFLVAVIQYAVTGALSMGGDAIFTSPSALSITCHALMSFLGVVLIAPLDVVITALVYFELREEKEGFDLELRAQGVVERMPLMGRPS